MAQSTPVIYTASTLFDSGRGRDDGGRPGGAGGTAKDSCPTGTLMARMKPRARFDAGWRAGVRRRQVRSLLLRTAAVLAAAALWFIGRSGIREAPGGSRGPTLPVVVIARLDTALGVVEREGATGWLPIAVGDPLLAGTHIRTGGAGAGLRVADGRSVRIAEASRLRWDAAETLTLESGAVYVDSGRSEASASPFEVRTARGTVRETGTQFEVRLEEAALRVRVREGRVAVTLREPPVEAVGGSELLLDDRGGVARRSIPAHGPDWSWVVALAPAFEMDGRSPDELLAWAAREAGWQLRYADDGTRRQAQAARLHGSIRGVGADQVPMVVLPSTGLRHRLDRGVLWVESSPTTRGPR